MRLASKGGIAAKRSDLSDSPLKRISWANLPPAWTPMIWFCTVQFLTSTHLVDMDGLPVSATHSSQVVVTNKFKSFSSLCPPK